MNKKEVLEKINSCIDYVIRANNMLYRGKVYVLGDNIHSFYKTKRGAEGENKRLSNVSYYDEMTFQMVNCGGYEIFEILENEIADINNVKTWYRVLKNNWHNIAIYHMDKEYLHNAEKYVTNENTLKYIREAIKDITETKSFLNIPEYEENGKEPEIIETEEVNQESIVNEVKKTSTIENTNNTESNTQESNITVNVTFNTEKSGIELHFTDKPDQEILNSIKANGFRWSKYQKIWYCKDSAEKREFLKSIGLLNDNSENNETIELKEVVKAEYPEIDINDIESYIIDEKLSQAENSVSMFRREDKNHTKEIQATLRSMNDDVITLIESGCNDYIAYRAKEYLQRAKKKYYDNYVKMLYHKANNPSWAVTGRGNLNVNRYNKKMDQYNRMIQESSQILNDFNNKIEYFTNQIKKESQQKFETELKTAIENIDNNQTFEKIKVDINAGAAMNIFNIDNNNRLIKVTAHKLNDYFIIKNWGYWRIYDKNGNEIEVIKRTIKTLDEAKKLCLYIVMEESKNKAAV